MITLLKRAIELNLIQYIDIQIAITLEKKNLLLILIFTLLSSETRAGHFYLCIDQLEPNNLFQGRELELANSLWNIVGKPTNDQIYNELKKSNAVSYSYEFTITPLILFDNKLYFQRIWSDEEIIVNFFNRNLLKSVNEDKLSNILNLFFKRTKIVDWQKIAVTIALTSQVSIISGGPGTGKTTTIARLLATLVKLNDKKNIIKLAAPTGKAANRLTESLNYVLKQLNLSSYEFNLIPLQTQTIHQLLGAKKNSNLMYFNENNLLSLDTLIIDEASMIDLFMMARLFNALPKNASVIFLCDKDQLNPVNIGAILSTICNSLTYGYSFKRINQLTKITGNNLSHLILDDGIKIKDIICILHKNYRFNKTSGVGQLTTAIKQNNIKTIKSILIKKNNNITFHSIGNINQYNQLLYNITNIYLKYWNTIKISKNYKEILTIFNKYRIITALNDGPYGIIELNYKLEQYFLYKNIIKYSGQPINQNYEGRPIIITENNFSLGLSNGDIGIILYDEKHHLKAFFKSYDGKIKSIYPNCLPKHETTFVMTIHKSQGSEFEHVIFILTPTFTPIISKELIYTAVSRTKKYLEIYADKTMFIQAVQLSFKKRSSLINKILKNEIQLL